MKVYFTAALFIVCSVFAAAQDAEKPAIAIMNVESSTLEQSKTEVIYEYIIDKINRSNKYITVERVKLDKAIDELKISLSGLIDNSTAAEIGKFTGAGYILLPAANLQEGDYHLSLRIINVETAEIEKTVVEKTNDFSKIDDLTKKAVANLLDITMGELDAPVKRFNDILPSGSKMHIGVFAGTSIPVADTARLFKPGILSTVKGTYNIVAGTGSFGFGIKTGLLFESTLKTDDPGSEVLVEYNLLAFPVFASADYCLPFSIFIISAEVSGGLLLNLSVFPGSTRTPEFGLSAGLSGELGLGMRLSKFIVLNIRGGYLHGFYLEKPYTGITAGLDLKLSF